MFFRETQRFWLVLQNFKLYAQMSEESSRNNPTTSQRMDWSVCSDFTHVNL